MQASRRDRPGLGFYTQVLLVWRAVHAVRMAGRGSVPERNGLKLYKRRRRGANGHVNQVAIC